MNAPQRRLALTFDDGPDPVWTPRVLDVLRDAGATATFFVLGERVRAAPGLLFDIAAGGHTVGLHGDAHLDHSQRSAGHVAADTDAALATLRAVGVEPSLWRLPWGRRGPQTDASAEALGLQIVGWDVDTHDWRGDGWADQPAEHAVAAREGAIVLLHDALGPGATRPDCSNTLEIVTGLLDEAADAGTSVRALADRRGSHV